MSKKNIPLELTHEIEPVIFKSAKILILGTFPSPKSREYGFFYGHPRNRFWRVLSIVLGTKFPETIAEKRELLIKHDIALWDVLASCTITGASDASIKNPVANDIASAISGTDISQIFTTGQKATKLYQKYLEDSVGIKTISLPSTSPANARMSLEELVDKYSVIKKYLGENNA